MKDSKEFWDRSAEKYVKSHVRDDCVKAASTAIVVENYVYTEEP